MKINIKTAYIYSICIYLICLPLGAVNIGAFGSALRLFAILPILLSFVYIKKIKSNSMIVLYFLYSLFSLFSVLYSVDSSASLDKSSSFILLFLLLLSSSIFDYSSHDISAIKKSLVWSSRISAVICILFARYNNGRLWLTGNGVINEDPNYFCMYLAFGVINSLQVLLSNKRLKNKIIPLIELTVYVSICFLSGSRGGTIAIILGGVTYLIFSGDKIFDFKKLLVIILGFIILYFGLSLLSDSIADRFTIASAIESNGTGRFDLWNQGFIIFKSSSFFRRFFGYGISSTITCFRNFGFPKVNVMHNMFIESLLEIGIIGALIYTFMVFSFLKRAYLFKDKFCLAVLICMIVMSLSTSISAFKPYINIMLFILCISNCNKINNLPERNDN